MSQHQRQPNNIRRKQEDGEGEEATCSFLRPVIQDDYIRAKEKEGEDEK